MQPKQQQQRRSAAARPSTAIAEQHICPISMANSDCQRSQHIAAPSLDFTSPTITCCVCGPTLVTTSRKAGGGICVPLIAGPPSAGRLCCFLLITMPAVAAGRLSGVLVAVPPSAKCVGDRIALHAVAYTDDDRQRAARVSSVSWLLAAPLSGIECCKCLHAITRCEKRAVAFFAAHAPTATMCVPTFGLLLCDRARARRG